MGTDDAIVFTTGQQANLGTLGTLLGPGDTVVVDSGDHASLLDGAILSRAKLRAFRHNRMDKLERSLERAAADGGGVMVVVDGVFSMEGDIAPLPGDRDLAERFGARLMVDEAHGVGVLGARGAGHGRAARRRGPRRPADGNLLQVAGLLRRLPRRSGRRDRVPPHPESVVPLHGIRRPGRSRRRPGRPPRDPLVDGPPLLARVLQNARHLNRGLHDLGFSVVDPSPVATARGVESILTPVVPIRVGDDWKAVLPLAGALRRGCLRQRRRPPCRPARRGAC